MSAGPDGLLRKWWSSITDAKAPGLRMVDSEGRYYLKRCKCGHRIRHWKSKEPPGRWVCGRCGADWPYRDRYMLKGSVQRTPDPGIRDRILSDVASIGVLASRFLDDDAWRWEARLYVAKAISGLSARDFQREVREIVPDYPGPRSLGAVMRRVTDGRKEWIRRLAAAGYDV